MGETPVPVTLLTGFLGAGKTTLVNRILTEAHGTRVAVLVNEFGDVPVDGRLVVSSDEEIVELANGCVCCTVRGDLVRAISGLLRRRRARLLRKPFDRLLIETSGLASPGPVLQTLAVEPELAQATLASGVVTLAHAALIAAQLEHHPEAEEQVGYADLLLLNHVDRADEPELLAAEAALRARNALAPLWRAEHATVDVAEILALEHDSQADPHATHGAGAHTSGAGTVVLESDQPLDLARLKMWLTFLATRRNHDLWRIKGILACIGQAHEVRVQAVQEFLELGPGEGPAPESSVLVVIGRDLDEAELRRGWAACLPA